MKEDYYQQLVIIVEAKLNNHPLVSIVMNCYNGESFLRDSIKSVLSQTYENWELIFWDNKSNDKSKNIFFEFKDKRLKYFEAPKHTMLGEARNNALEKCNGEFISFLDVDDWWTSEKLYNQVKVLKSNNDIKFNFTNYWFCDQRNNKKVSLYSKKKSYSGFLTNYLLKSYDVGISTVTFKKEIINDTNKPFENNSYFCDFNLFMNLSTKYKFYFEEQPLTYYRWQNKNFTHNNFDLYVSEMNRLLKSFQKFEKFENFKFFKINIDYINCLLLLKNKEKKNYLKKALMMKWSLKKIKLLMYYFVPLKILEKLIRI